MLPLRQKHLKISEHVLCTVSSYEFWLKVLLFLLQLSRKFDEKAITQNSYPEI